MNNNLRNAEQWLLPVHSQVKLLPKFTIIFLRFESCFHFVSVCVCSDLQPTFLDYEVINKRKHYVNSGIQLPTDIFKTDNKITKSYSSKYEYFKM